MVHSQRGFLGQERTWEAQFPRAQPVGAALFVLFPEVAAVENYPAQKWPGGMGVSKPYLPQSGPALGIHPEIQMNFSWEPRCIWLPSAIFHPVPLPQTLPPKEEPSTQEALGVWLLP